MSSDCRLLVYLCKNQTSRRKDVKLRENMFIIKKNTSLVIKEETTLIFYQKKLMSLMVYKKFSNEKISFFWWITN